MPSRKSSLVVDVASWVLSIMILVALTLAFFRNRLLEEKVKETRCTW